MPISSATAVLLCLCLATQLCNSAALGDCASPIASSYGRLKLLTVMGDSNSDAGSAPYVKRTFHNPALDWPISNYYYQGRFSNGPIWTDVLNDCDCFEVRGYAVGFGTHCTANSVASQLLQGPAAALGALFPPVMSVTQQAADYIKNDIKVNRLTPFRGVYIWAAANDLSALFLSDPQAPFGNVTKLSDEAIQGVAACAADTVRSLYAAGERTFILANLQPLEKSAFITQLVALGLFTQALKTDTLSPRIASYVAKFNTNLREQVQQLRTQHPLARIFHHDIHKPLDAFLTGNRTDLGFTDLRNACVNFENAAAGFQSLNTTRVTGQNAVASVCPQPGLVADWDVNHFTTRAHKQVIAAEVVAFLKRKGLLSDFAC